MTKHAALIINGEAHIFDVAHIESGDYFEDNALQYMAERTGAIECDGWAFGDSYGEVVAWAADKKVALAV
jgi:hypothetical protein